METGGRNARPTALFGWLVQGRADVRGNDSADPTPAQPTGVYLRDTQRRVKRREFVGNHVGFVV